MRASTALGRNIQFLESDKSMFHAHKCMDGKKEERRFPAGAEQRKIVVSKGKVDSQCTSGLTIVHQVNKKTEQPWKIPKLDLLIKIITISHWWKLRLCFCYQIQCALDHFPVLDIL